MLNARLVHGNTNLGWLTYHGVHCCPGKVAGAPGTNSLNTCTSLSCSHAPRSKLKLGPTSCGVMMMNIDCQFVGLSISIHCFKGGHAQAH